MVKVLLYKPVSKWEIVRLLRFLTWSLIDEVTQYDDPTQERILLIWNFTRGLTVEWL